MTYCDEHEGGCGASLTQTDYDAGYCTQCKRQLTTKETRTMDNDEKIDAIEQTAFRVGGDVYYNYSGRGMFSKQCLGIVCDNPQAVIEEAASRGLRGAEVDGMGRQSIVYWRSVTDS